MRRKQQLKLYLLGLFLIISMIIPMSFHFKTFSLIYSSPKMEITAEYSNNIQIRTNGLTYIEEWSQTWGGASHDWGYGVALDKNNNSYLIGVTYSFGDLDGDAFLVKYNLTGNQKWYRTFGGTDFDRAWGIVIDDNNNIYIAGETESSGDFDAFLAKYDDSGNQIWFKTWGGSNDDYGRDVAIYGSDSIYLIGYTLSFGAGFEDVFLAKYNSAGQQQWNKTWGNSGYDEGYTVTVDLLNNIYVTGQTGSNIGTGVNNAFLLKYGSSGNLIWSRGWSQGDNAEYGEGVAVDSSNNVYLTGTADTTGGGNYEVFLAKYDAAGNQLWNRTWGGPYTWGYGIAIDSNNNIFLCGGPGDAFLVKYTSTGNQLWNKTWGRVEQSIEMADEGYDIALDNSNNCYLAGTTQKIEGYTAYYEAFLVKYGIDSDNDGLTNDAEFYTYKTNPNNPDTDGDTYSDGAEVIAGTDPLDPNDYPGKQEPIPAFEFVTIFLGFNIGILLFIYILKNKKNPP